MTYQASFTRRLLSSGALCLTLVLGLSACSYNPPRPPVGPTPADALMEVPYPPPPARVETIPPQKNDHDVWLDGQWVWDGTTWTWTPGAWTKPPSGAYFSSWTTVRRSDGKLFFASAAWRSKDGRPLAVGSEGGLCAPVEAPSAKKEAQR